MTEQAVSGSHGTKPGGRGKTVAVIIGAVVLIGVALTLYRLGYIDPEATTAWLREASGSWWAPLAFIGLYTIFNVFLIPATLLTLTAGVIWGWLVGGLWVLAASTVASFVPYLIARNGAGWIESILRGRANDIHGKLQNEGFTTLLLLRLIPVFPYNVLNYASGLAGLRARDYVLATFIGTIPGIFIFTYLADSISQGLVSPGEAFVKILIAGALLGGLVLVTRFFSAKVKKRVE